MNYNILNSLLDTDFSVDTFVEFLNKGIKKQTDFTVILNEIADAYDDNQSIVEPLTTAQVNAIVNNKGLDTSNPIALQEGYLSIGNLAKQYSDNFANYLNGTLDSIENGQVTIFDQFDRVLSDTISLDTVITELNDNLASAVCQQAALVAAKEDTVSDKLNVFKNYITSKTGSDFIDSSPIAQFYKDSLMSKLKPHELLDYFRSKMGVDEANQSTPADPFSLMNADISDITGANPLGTFSFNCVRDGFRTLGKVIAATAKGIFDGIKTIAQPIFESMHRWTNEHLNYFYDIKDIGPSNEAPCFKGFQYQIVNWNPSVGDALQFAVPEYWSSTLYSKMMTHANEWYYIKTFGGELCVKYTSVNVQWNSVTERCVVIPSGVTAIFKPYPLRYETLDYTISTGKVIINGKASTMQSRLFSNSQGLYATTQDDEKVLYNAFSNGFAYTAWCLNQYELFFNGIDTEEINVKYAFDYKDVEDEQVEVSNLEWLKNATGYTTVAGGNVEFTQHPEFPEVYDISSSTLADCSSIYALALKFMSIICMVNFQLQTAEGGDYERYIPYSLNATGISQGKYTIKTDSQNQTVANALLAVVVVTLVVATVAIQGAIIIKNLKRKSWLKKTDFVGKMDNKMWSTKDPLTDSEARKYIRYRRKLENCNFLSKGIAAATASNSVLDAVSPILGISQSQDQPIDLLTIKHLIVG